jgi:hypothetical protein
METADGYKLKEGDVCFVSCQCLTGEHNLSPTPRKAFYRDAYAISQKLDFTLSRLRTDCEEVEICQVWKNNPNK